MDEADDARRYTISCIGSDGTNYELTVESSGGQEALIMSDGARAQRLSKGAYKVVGKSLYLWCNHPDAP